MIRVPESKPKEGFAIQKTADVSRMNDPYRTYEQSVVDKDEVWNALS